MLGLGTIINCAGILLGGFFGLFAGRCGHPERQEALQKACGIAVLFIGISGAMAGMLQVGGSALSSGKAMLVALSLALGTVLGSCSAWKLGLPAWANGSGIRPAAAATRALSTPSSPPP